MYIKIVGIERQTKQIQVSQRIPIDRGTQIKEIIIEHKAREVVTSDTLRIGTIPVKVHQVGMIP